jgi:hypothetical protein
VHVVRHELNRSLVTLRGAMLGIQARKKEGS